MGFPILDDSNYKQHLNLKSHTWICLNDDIDNFCNVPDKPNITGFINKVFLNFYKQANASISSRLSEYRIIYQQLLSSCLPDGADELYASLLEALLKQKETELSISLEKEKGKYKNIRLSEKVKSCLRESPESPHYDNQPGKYIQSILEEYSSLPVARREQIFFKEILDDIHDAIETHHALQVTSGGHTRFIIPYGVMTDKCYTFNYLAGYTAEITEGLDISKLKPASLRLSRITILKTLRTHRYTLSTVQKQRIKKEIETKGIPFLVGDNTTILVRLTEQGVKQYRQQIYQRPAYITCSDHMKLLEFNCTEQQILNYFFKFGKDAQVIQPLSLRQKMTEKYQHGVTAYLKLI